VEKEAVGPVFFEEFLKGGERKFGERGDIPPDLRARPLPGGGRPLFRTVWIFPGRPEA